ncbi:flagellar motor stator protein MotA [Sulfitobacter mediterraneus]|jgi:chemotaxis protein MotA|uniref:Chemotaxis protein MotA n=1 Tax=Sulfitobacter mediterraneus TaxID=83219 RepID=A0A061SMG5_9RHOB|nr:flagellar motor stator protein MotA [Sulfitobacter mediterraneus]KAJ02047.1 flagellar motor protein MotA [Sulfitobacter mediterraneus]KIN77122.1 Flagellar motor protein MotA [Sulfitobacter mediterraneus KCTC 32188]MBM1312079.1 flagellar motor stator protein MotA [Sulfitobacter mediterraneus]MBM1315959.1 flagellar motor stator protein MotA [Sulfitobacter mediterraneus]MBM1324322.1 flagellar motor stator protein MotA [Sulfitobacter mediterraneus]
MTVILGFVVVMGMVFGGYILSGGEMDIITYALPFEGMMIGGAAIGSFIAANSLGNIKGAAKGLAKTFKGPKWKNKDYIDLLNLMFTLTKMYQQNGMLSLDEHIENPKESTIFSQYPKLQKDHFAIDLITDSFRMLALQFDDPYQAEDVINRKLKKHHHEALVAPHGLTVVGDALPAIGIVAAVLGVIKTMASIDKPPAILGGMIGGALVGTFLGVFLAYLFVAPLANRLEAIEEQDGIYYAVIRDIFIAMLHNHSPAICTEIGRGNIPSDLQPTFYEMEEARQSAPEAA